MDAYVRGINPTLNRALSPLSVAPGSSALKLLLVLFGGIVAPKLPDHILKWFEYVPFKLFVIFLIVWTSNYDPAMAIAITLVFYVTFNLINDKGPFEAFEPAESFGTERDHE